MIAFEKFEKSYGSKLIVKADVQLDENFYWLKGGNGVGKSTLLKSVAGLIPYSGHILLNGLDIRNSRVAYRNAVSYAEAEPLYAEFLTGHDLIAFYRDCRNGDAQQAEMLIETMQVGSYLHQKTGTYSSGMLKKLSLVLAFIGSPQLIMLDEPFITIDTNGLQQLGVLVKQALENNVTVWITSHQQVLLDTGMQPAMLEIRERKLLKMAL